MGREMFGNATGVGYRKVILVNEHFVVHGTPAIAMPIPRPVEVSLAVRPGSGTHMVFKTSEGETDDHLNDTCTSDAVRSMLIESGVSDLEVSITLECTVSLPGWSGLGSSAGFCVAVARAISGACGLGLNDSQINQVAYAGEKVFSRNPSGIDNTVATYGRIVWYQRNQENPWEFLDLGTPMWILIGNSGVSSLTRDQVARVAEFKEQHPKIFRGLSHEARDLAFQIRAAIVQGHLEELGRLMDRGHMLLRQIGVSSNALEDMIGYCRSQGALGAKLTGAGGGGCMIALVSSSFHGTQMGRGLQNHGYDAFCVEMRGDYLTTFQS